MDSEFYEFDNLTEKFVNEIFGMVPRMEVRPELTWSTTIYFSIAILSLVANLKVLCCLARSWNQRKRKSTRVLIAHMTVITISFTFCVLVLEVEQVKAFTYLKKGGVCEIILCLEDTLFAVLAFNNVAIIHERFKRFISQSRSKLVYRKIIVIWTISLLISVPSIFPFEQVIFREGGMFRIQQNGCKLTPLNRELDTFPAYQLLKLFSLHVFEIGYTTYLLVKLRSKLRYLHDLMLIPNERMRRKIRSIRFIYIHFITSILVWLSQGTLLIVYFSVKSFFPDDKTTASSQNSFSRALSAFHLIHMVFIPLIYLLLITENPRCKDLLCCCARLKLRISTVNWHHHCNRNNNQENTQYIIGSRERNEQMEMSVFRYQQHVSKAKSLKVDTILTTALSFGESNMSTVALTTRSNKKVVL